MIAWARRRAIPIAATIGCVLAIAVSALLEDRPLAVAQESVCRFLPTGVDGAVIDAGTLIDDGSSCQADLIIGERDGLPADQTSFVGVFTVDITPAIGFDLYYDSAIESGVPAEVGHLGAVVDQVFSVEEAHSDIYIVFCRGDWVGHVVNAYDTSGARPDTRSIAVRMAADIDARFVAEGASGCNNTTAGSGDQTSGQPVAPSRSTGQDDGGGIPWPPIVIVGGVGAAGLVEARRRRGRRDRGEQPAENADGRPECAVLETELAGIEGRYADLQQQTAYRNNRIARVNATYEQITQTSAELAAVSRALDLPYTAPSVSDSATGVGVGVGITAEMLTHQARALAAEVAAADAARIGWTLSAAGADEAAARAVARVNPAPGASSLGNLAGGVAAVTGSVGLYNEMGRQEQLRLLGRHQEQLGALYREVAGELTRLTTLNTTITSMHRSLVRDAVDWEQRRQREGCSGSAIDLDALDTVADAIEPATGTAAGPVAPAAVALQVQSTPTPTERDLWDYDCDGLEAEIADYHRRLDQAEPDLDRLERHARQWATRRATLEATDLALRQQWAEIAGRLQLAQNDWLSFQAAGQAFNWLGWLAGYAGAPWLALALGVSSLGTSVGSGQVAPDDAQRILLGRLEVRFERLASGLQRARSESARANNELTSLRRPLQSQYAEIQAKRHRCHMQPGPRGPRPVNYTEARLPPAWSSATDAAEVTAVLNTYINGSDQERRDQLARVLADIEAW